MMLKDTYSAEIEATLAKYPPENKRAAVMPLLHLAQRENGYVTKSALYEIADLCGVAVTEVASIMGFYTLYHDQPGGKYRLQVCTDLPCALRGANEFLEQLCANVGVKVGETTADGMITIEAVTCLAGCNKAPMFQVQTGEGLEYYENQTVESAVALINDLVKR